MRLFWLSIGGKKCHFGVGGMASWPQSNQKSVVYTGGYIYIGGWDEVGKESASEYCTIGKATE